jgi:hypothetical protein
MEYIFIFLWIALEVGVSGSVYLEDFVSGERLFDEAGVIVCFLTG